MTVEQLQAVRAEKWRQKANPVLTLEDAETWIGATGVSLFLPRKTQLQAPAPSFVEAVLGETNATPAPAAIQNAFDLAIRLTASGAASPLNLFGTVSEQPDFLASQEALPFVFALRGDREWKRGPRDQSSPLVIESWKILQREGALTAPELQASLGREVTEGAVLRVLAELWTALRILPVYAAGEATAWELFESHHQKAAQAGSGMAQATALSALVSLYLESVIAATPDEIETFLSPLAPRSRIREAARGLSATRQLSSLSLAAQTFLFITGGLPEFPEIETPAVAEQPAPTDVPQMRERRRPFAPRPFVPDKGAEQRPRERKPFTPGSRPAFGQRPAAGGDARRPFKPRSTRPDADGPRKEWKPRTSQGPSDRKEWKPRPSGPRPSGPGEFRPRRDAGSGGFNKPYRKPAGEKSFGGAGTFKPRESGQQGLPPRKDWKPREGQGEFRPRRTEGGEGFKKPYRSSPGGPPVRRSFSTGAPGGPARPPRKEWKPRTEGASGERREFRPRSEGKSSERRTFKPRPPEGEFRPRKTEGSGGFKKPYRSNAGGPPAKKSFSPRGSGPGSAARPPRKEWKPRTEGAGEQRREFRPRREGEAPARREFKPRSTEGGFRPRREGGGFGDRQKPAGERRSFSKKPFGSKPPFEKPAGSNGRKPPQRERSAAGPDAKSPDTRRTGAKGPGIKRAGKSFSKSGSKPGKKFGPPKGGKKSAFGAKRPSRPGSKSSGGKPSFGKRPGKKKKPGE